MGFRVRVLNWVYIYDEIRVSGLGSWVYGFRVKGVRVLFGFSVVEPKQDSEGDNEAGPAPEYCDEDRGLSDFRTKHNYSFQIRPQTIRTATTQRSSTMTCQRFLWRTLEGTLNYLNIKKSGNNAYGGFGFRDWFGLIPC